LSYSSIKMRPWAHSRSGRDRLARRGGSFLAVDPRQISIAHEAGVVATQTEPHDDLNPQARFRSRPGSPARTADAWIMLRRGRFHQDDDIARSDDLPGRAAAE
jgi:hypothetical protein